MSEDLAASFGCMARQGGVSDRQQVVLDLREALLDGGGGPFPGFRRILVVQPGCQEAATLGFVSQALQVGEHPHDSPSPLIGVVARKSPAGTLLRRLPPEHQGGKRPVFCVLQLAADSAESGSFQNYRQGHQGLATDADLVAGLELLGFGEPEPALPEWRRRPKGATGSARRSRSRPAKAVSASPEYG